jgi:hypothetical protein
MGLGGGLLPPLVAELIMDIDKFSAGAVKAQVTSKSLADSTNAMFTKVGKGATVAFAGIAVASVVMAADFDAQMTRLYTAAGAPKKAVQDATGQILKLGDAVGFSGTQMAEALYHPVSAGLDLATSLQAVKYAAEEAQISGASLDDTTYALSSVMKAFNQDASQAHDTMALLNSIGRHAVPGLQHLGQKLGPDGGADGHLDPVDGCGPGLPDRPRQLRRGGGDPGHDGPVDDGHAVQAGRVPAGGHGGGVLGRIGRHRVDDRDHEEGRHHPEPAGPGPPEAGRHLRRPDAPENGSGGGRDRRYRG